METADHKWTKKKTARRMDHLGLYRTDEDRESIRQRNIKQGRYAVRSEKWIDARVYKQGTLRYVGKKYQILQMKYNGRMIAAGRAIWLQHHGSIPAGHVIRCKTNDPTNIDISNWMCITMKENWLLNRNNNTTPELAELENLLKSLDKIILKTTKQ